MTFTPAKFLCKIFIIIFQKNDSYFTFVNKLNVKICNNTKFYQQKKIYSRFRMNGWLIRQKTWYNRLNEVILYG